MARRRIRHYRRNPTTATWLILGAAIAGLAAYAVFSKKASAAPSPTPGPLPAKPGIATPEMLPSTLSPACKQKITEILPFAALVARDSLICKSNPQAQECLRATANAPTLQAYSSALQAACFGAPAYTGTLPALPAGLPVPTSQCQADFLAAMTFAAKALQGEITPEIMAQGQAISAQLDKTCGVTLT
jgi:hypothetical protein